MISKFLIILAAVIVQQTIASPEAYAAVSQAYAVPDAKGFVSILIGIYAKLAATGRIPFIEANSGAGFNWQRRAITSLQLVAPGLIILGLVMLVGN